MASKENRHLCILGGRGVRTHRLSSEWKVGTAGKKNGTILFVLRILNFKEWVEQNLPKLTGRAVAYLNSDMCVFGPDLVASASDPLKAVLEEAMRNVPDPSNPEQSYYDYWKSGSGNAPPGNFWVIRTENYLFAF